MQSQYQTGRVSTHSRLKAAGGARQPESEIRRSFNTQPPEGGWLSNGRVEDFAYRVSTHSRLKAAGPTSYGFD